MNKNIYAFLLISVFVLAACDKDQKAVKDIAGTWESVKVDGEVVPDSMKTTLTYNECKLKTEDYCDGSLYFSANDSTVAFEFRITDDGTNIAQKAEIIPGIEIELISEIQELTENTLTLSTQYTEDPVITEYERK